MKIKEIHLKNIRSIKDLNWKLPAKKDPAGWHVILGDNGAGKSSFLRALAVGLLGLERSAALWIDYSSWLRKNSNTGIISLKIQAESGDYLTVGDDGITVMVIGVGGAGSNAVSHMYSEGINGVDFVICNTDKHSLQSSLVPNKLQIGSKLTEGLGAGANPIRGEKAAIESEEQIRGFLIDRVKIVIIIAGMGGGTGTGAAPYIAKIAKELGILTISIVSTPFNFEGSKKIIQAELGIKKLKDNCDMCIVFPNDELREIHGNLPIRTAFAKADDLLYAAVKTFTELTTISSEVELNLDDVKALVKNSGAAILGSATTKGNQRAIRAAEEALSTITKKNDIYGSKKVLLSIMSGEKAELEMDELTDITEYIQNNIGEEAEVLFGHGIDPSLGNSIRVSIIVAGLKDEPNQSLTKIADELKRNDENRVKQILGELPEEDSLPKSVLNQKQRKEQSKNDYHNLKISFSVDKVTKNLITRWVENDRESIFLTAWGQNEGWFSAGFGPFRRFTGGDLEYNKLFDAPKHKRLAAHLSLFKENVALTEALNWLRELKFRSLEARASFFLNNLKAFINQPDFLPHGTKLEDITSDGVYFLDANLNRVNIEELGDGFRSVLSLTFELLRQLEKLHGDDIFQNLNKKKSIIVKISGVVLIDEIDAHLHPIWQKRIGYWLTKHFPYFQFFVTTHSPLVCQAAEHGSVYRLPKPGTNEEGGMVEGKNLNRLIFGNVLEAYGTDVFGLVNTQSEAGQAKTNRLTALNEQAISEGLSVREQQERDELRSTLPISDSEAFVKKLLNDL